MIEIEIKIKLNDKKQFINNILKKGANKVSSQIEKDIYYQHPSRDFSKTDEALRIREIDEKFILTYKGPKINKQSKTREEINLNIDDIFNMKNILDRLGFKKKLIVIKERDIYELNKIKIFIDHLEKLGYFAEFEIIVEDKRQINNKEKELLELIENLGYKDSKTITKSYLELILDLNEKN